jgi:hypothetical protein
MGTIRRWNGVVPSVCAVFSVHTSGSPPDKWQGRNKKPDLAVCKAGFREACRCEHRRGNYWGSVGGAGAAGTLSTPTAMGAAQLGATGAQQLGATGAQQVGATGAQQVATGAGAQQLGAGAQQPRFRLTLTFFVRHDVSQPPQTGAGAAHDGAGAAQPHWLERLKNRPASAELLDRTNATVATAAISIERNILNLLNVSSTSALHIHPRYARGGRLTQSGKHCQTVDAGELRSLRCSYRLCRKPRSE